MTYTHFVCVVCAHVYLTDEPQDPRHEEGYGVCKRCVDRRTTDEYDHDEERDDDATT